MKCDALCVTRTAVSSHSLYSSWYVRARKDKAKAALDYAEKMIPAYNVPYDWQNGAVQMAEAYYQLGETAKADEMMKALADKAVEYLTWYLSLDDNRFMISTREFEYHWLYSMPR